jgi:uncharacterized protein (DUF302 family)
MKINRLFLSLLLATGFAYANVQSNMAEVMLTAELQGSEGNKEAEIDALMKKIGTIGFETVAANKNLQVHYYNKYEEKNVEMLSFFAMTNKEKIRPLLLSNPDFGAYAPFNFLVYKTLDTVQDNNTWYGHLASDTMLDIIGEKSEENRKAFKSMVGSLDTLVNKEMTPALSKRFEHTKPLPAHGLTKFVKTFEKTDDLETYIEDFITEHDSTFSKHEFLIAGFIDYKFEYGDMDLAFDKYDAYWVSLLCHFKFSNAIFNRGIPEGGMFAPCSVYFYIPKGTNELHVGYASVDNWINALNFRDQKRIDYMKAIDAEVREIFESLGFTKLDPSAKPMFKAPVTPENNSELVALKEELARVKAERDALKGTRTKATEKKTIDIKAMKKEPKIIEPLAQKVFKTAKLKIGAETPEKQSAYYAAQPQHLAELKAALKKNGFKILAEDEILKGHTVLSVTNPQLQATNTYMAVLNIHLNGTEEVRVQNPSYLGAAYLGDSYKKGAFIDTLKSLEASLGDLYEVNDNYETDDLEDYQFMMGMPRFDDVMEVAEGEGLDSHIMSDKASKYVAYTLKLPNGAILVGHKLRKRTNKFLSKIAAERNTNLLPYQSLIKEGKAVILDPKYYLALSLPLLSM